MTTKTTKTTKPAESAKASKTARKAADTSTAADEATSQTPDASRSMPPRTAVGATTGVAPSRNGALPRLTVTPVSTPCFDVGTHAATLAYRMRAIVTFNGPSGTGKTTTAVAATQYLPMRFVYVKLRHKAGTKEVATSIHNALHPGQPLKGRVREADYVDSCVDTLSMGTIGVVADEVHYAGVPGLIMLAQLWESVHNLTGSGFPMLLVGSDVDAAASAAPELQTRLAGSVDFGPLEDDELFEVLARIDERCAATSQALLNKVNQVYARGLLRFWMNFVKMMNQDESKAGTPITPAEIRAFLAMQGKSVARAA